MLQSIDKPLPPEFTINARKRQARAESYPNTMFRGRCVYQSL